METSYIHKKQDVFTHALTCFVISAVNLNELSFLVSMWIELVICIFSLLWILHFQKRRKLPLGPFSVPLFGTLELFTTKKKFLEFITDEKHNKCYKDFCSFYLGRNAIRLTVPTLHVASTQPRLKAFVTMEFVPMRLRIHRLGDLLRNFGEISS